MNYAYGEQMWRKTLMKWENNNSSLEDALKYTCEKNDMEYIPADKAVPVDHTDILDEDTGLIRRFKRDFFIQIDSFV